MITERDILISIDGTLKQLLAIAKMRNTVTQQHAMTTAPISVASDADLDSTHGDPIVKFMPRDWTGDEFRQQPFSATTPEFLEMLAKVYDMFYARKTAENDPKAKWEAITAARARGWAARLRAGWKRDEVASGDIKW